ncbi:MAG: alpha/beta fold hydrolase, partial [Nanoarchaeota archaeon]|nr:alpha/beta fold hydrolase [Nanoarchaeota archaeon]
GKNFEEKAFVVQSLKNNTTKISNNIIHEDRNETIIKLIEIDMQYLLLCNLTDKCYDRPSIQSRAYQETFNLRDACQEIIYLDEIYNNLNKTINTTINKTLFNETNNKKMFESLMSKTAILLLEKLPENASNSKIIKEFLERKNTINESSDLKNDDWIILELIKNKPKKCNEKTINTSLEKIQLKKIELKEEPEIIELTFEEPKTECCIFGVCKECCITDECTSNLTHIIFLHGHAFNKAVEADYSLESFNKLQNALEKQGYINAGALSLYDINMIPENSWGVMGQPISIKASYYLDVYQSTENYYWVQTKSDNIDTYAVKLNDIINTIIDKTGSEKSVIIAHSMGGLVARRYLQIFGSDKVKTLIMLGTPNHGISGKIADYCSITGEKLECRDMKEESLFMNKLNRNSLPLFNIYNVIGIGCDMQGQDGDGIVLKESASLEGAQNYLIKGECKGLDIFHRELTNIEKHPEIYKIILNALE